MVAEYSLAWNIAESPLCIEIYKEWIDDDNANLQQVAWASLTSYLLTTSNDDIDFGYHKSLLKRVEQEIHSSDNRVRYTMNNYVISLGGTIPMLTELRKEVGERIGKVSVNMGDTACKTPLIKPYLEKMEARNRIGKKKKTAKC